MNKIILALLIFVSSFAHAIEVQDKIDANISKGKQVFELTTSRTVANQAIVHCIRMGYYSEMRSGDGDIIVHVDASAAGRRKQAKIMTIARGHAADIMSVYGACRGNEELYVFGLYRDDVFVGNLLYGCGERFLYMLKEKVDRGDVQFGEFDFMNMFGSILSFLKAAGYTINVTKEEGAMFLGTVVPVGEEM